MIKEFILQGLNCANCAAKIEGSAKKLAGVSAVSLNFVTATLRLHISPGYVENIYEKIVKIVHAHEPDVVVREKTIYRVASAENNKTSLTKILPLLAGLLLLVGGMFAEKLLHTNYPIPLAIFIGGYLLLGGKVLTRAAKNIWRGKIFDENFLMAIATIGAFALGEYAEALAVMLFYQTGMFFQEAAVTKSKRTITSLLDIRPDYANLFSNSHITKVDPHSVDIGSIIIVQPGEKIPLDGQIIEGESCVDTAALNGEAIPRKVAPPDMAFSGWINQNGLLKIKVTQTFGESTASKIISLVENAAAKKAPTESFITKFALYYTPAVVSLAALLAIIPPLFWGTDWLTWLNRALIFLVVSCPCALVISIPLGFFGGIGNASKKGILVKGGNYLEALNNLEIVVFDKTGTLTRGLFTVSALCPAQGLSEQELLQTAALAEAYSNHPIALSIKNAYGHSIDKSSIKEYNELTGLGVAMTVNNELLLAGSISLMTKMGITIEEKPPANNIEEANNGIKVYIALAGLYIGHIIISDIIKPDSRDVITDLKSLGIKKTVMLTGDDPIIAQGVARKLKIDECYGGLLPQEKAAKLSELSRKKHPGGKLAFVGDGINDAPVLALADIGVAMGALGADAAIESADIVLMSDEPTKLIEAMGIARFTKHVVWQNIIFALGVKVVFLLLGALGLASLWEAVFADVGVALLAILNAMRVLRA
ncbi:MAG: heavy metal translocating P-type ATPase [Clostridiales bacterium]|nr:heavy metal translocating P-type ATPase [Clostridiales bacterium]